MRKPRSFEDALYDVLEFLIDEQAWLTDEESPGTQAKTESAGRWPKWLEIPLGLLRRRDKAPAESPEP